MEPDAPHSLSLDDAGMTAARFCLRCGGPLALLPRFGRPRPVCGRCGFVLFQAPAAAVAAAVVRGREVLLVQRRIAPFRGAWGFPAGYQEYDESAEAAAVREVREETGLQVELQRVLAVCYTTDDPRKRANLVCYVARAVAGEVCAADDAADARFFPLDGLPPVLAFANNRLLLDRLREQCPSGDLY